MCRRAVDLAGAVGSLGADPPAGLTPQELGALERIPAAFEAAVALVHTLGPKRWRTGLAALAENAAAPCGSPPPTAPPAAACPAYLEYVESSDVFPGMFDARALGGDANRRQWARVLSHSDESGAPIQATAALRR